MSKTPPWGAMVGWSLCEPSVMWPPSSVPDPGPGGSPTARGDGHSSLSMGAPSGVGGVISVNRGSGVGAGKNRWVRASGCTECVG